MRVAALDSQCVWRVVADNDHPLKLVALNLGGPLLHWRASADPTQLIEARVRDVPSSSAPGALLSIDLVLLARQDVQYMDDELLEHLPLDVQFGHPLIDVQLWREQQGGRDRPDYRTTYLSEELRLSVQISSRLARIRIGDDEPKSLVIDGNVSFLLSSNGSICGIVPSLSVKEIGVLRCALGA